MIVSQSARDRFEEFRDDAEVRCVARSQSYNEYEIVWTKSDLANDELALICDGGNVPFGFSKIGNTIKIYTN